MNNGPKECLSPKVSSENMIKIAEQIVTSRWRSSPAGRELKETKEK
jgi:hypothetical protein